MAISIGTAFLETTRIIVGDVKVDYTVNKVNSFEGVLYAADTGISGVFFGRQCDGC